MDPLYQFATALLSAHAPWWLFAIPVVAVGVRCIGPIRLNLSIGERAGRPLRSGFRLPNKQGFAVEVNPLSSNLPLDGDRSCSK